MASRDQRGKPLLQPIEEHISTEPTVPCITYTLPSPTPLSLPLSTLAPLPSNRLSKAPLTSRTSAPTPITLATTSLSLSNLHALPSSRPFTQQSLPTSKGSRSNYPNSNNDTEGDNDSLSPNFTLASTKKAVHSKSTSNIHTSYNSQAFWVPSKKLSEADREVGKDREMPKRNVVKEKGTSKEKDFSKERDLVRERDSTKIRESTSGGHRGGRVILAPTKAATISQPTPSSSTKPILPEPEVAQVPGRHKASSCPPRVEIPEEVLASIRSVKKNIHEDLDQVNAGDDDILDTDLNSYANGASNHDEDEDDGFYDPFPNKTQKASEEEVKPQHPINGDDKLEVKIPLSNAANLADFHTSPTSTQIYNRISSVQDPPPLNLEKIGSKKKSSKLSNSIPALHKTKSKSTTLLDGQTSPCSSRLTGKKTSVCINIF